MLFTFTHKLLTPHPISGPDQPADSKKNPNYSELVIKKNFTPELYVLDKNNRETFLGRGAYGDVYRANSRSSMAVHGLPEEVAVKSVIWTIAKATGYEEKEWTFLLQNAAGFQHENIVQYFYLSKKVVQKQKILTIYMEFCEDDLNKYTDRNDVSVSDIKHVVTGVVRGLEYIHDLKSIHRDIKPQNVLLKKRNPECNRMEDMIVKLADLGTIKLVNPDNTSATNTAGIGSPSFMAPEVLRSRDSGKTQTYGRSCDV